MTSKLISIAVRDQGQAKLFRIDGHGMSLETIRSYVKEEVPLAHPVLIGVEGGKKTPSSNDNSTEPEVA